MSAKVEGCLTARPISRAGAKAGLSDPAVLDGKAVAQQIKGTPGITGLSPLSVHSGEEVWHLNTSGCWTSNRLPTNRLITANPKVGNCKLTIDNCKLPIARAASILQRRVQSATKPVV